MGQTNTNPSPDQGDCLPRSNLLCSTLSPYRTCQRFRKPVSEGQSNILKSIPSLRRDAGLKYLLLWFAGFSQSVCSKVIRYFGVIAATWFEIYRLKTTSYHQHCLMPHALVAVAAEMNYHNICSTVGRFASALDRYSGPDSFGVFSAKSCVCILLLSCRCCCCCCCCWMLPPAMPRAAPEFHGCCWCSAYPSRPSWKREQIHVVSGERVMCISALFQHETLDISGQKIEGLMLSQPAGRTLYGSSVFRGGARTRDRRHLAWVFFRCLKSRLVVNCNVFSCSERLFLSLVAAVAHDESGDP